jgi:hypothetical protein
MNSILHDPVASSATDVSFNGDHRDVLTPEKLDSIVETAARCAEDPLFDDWVAAVEEYRRINNAVPDAD